MSQRQVKISMEKPLRLKPVLLGFGVQFVFFVFHVLLGAWTRSSPLELNSYFLLFGCGFWFLALLHTFFKMKAMEESNELLRVEKLRQERGQSGTLFQSNEIVQNSFQQNFMKFEKYFLPILTLLFSAMILWLTYLYYKEYRNLPIWEAPDNIFKASAFIAGSSFLLLMLGLFIRALAEEGNAYLRGPSTMMLAGAALSASEAGALILFTNGWLENLNFLYWLGIGFFFIVGFELILNTFLFLLKPVHALEERKPPYDSRVFWLLTSTGSAWKSFNAMVDYQFGFRLSESWLYKAFLKFVIPFLLFQLLAAVLCTSFVMIPSGHVGVVERFGHAYRTQQPWLPGLHFKLPWPIDSVSKVNVAKIRILEVGHKNDDHDHLLESQREALSHYKETDLFAVRRKSTHKVDESYMELISISAIIHYHANVEALENYIYQYQSVEESLKAYLHAELSGFLLEKTIDQRFAVLVTVWSQEFAERFRSKMKKAMPGIVIDYIALTNIHIPIELEEAVNEKFIAVEKQKISVLKAKTEAVQIATQSVQEASIVKNEGFREMDQANLKVQEDAKRITDLREIYQKYGAVFLQRELSDIIESYLSKRKIDFISPDIQLFLEDGHKAANALESFKE